MGKLGDALKRGMQNGGRKTVVGGELTDYAETKAEHIDIAKNAQALQGRGIKKGKK